MLHELTQRPLVYLVHLLPDLFKSDGPHVVDHDRPEHGAEAAPPEHGHRHEADDARQAANVKICHHRENISMTTG